MKYFVCFLSSTILLTSIRAQINSRFISDPQYKYSELYNDVELKKVFKDSKTFADAIPRANPKKILLDYNTQKEVSGFDLVKFVNKNFIIPSPFASKYRSKEESTGEHIKKLWDILLHPADISTNHPSKALANEDSLYGSLIPLPYPYIVPGGRFREIYYWDSYFSCLGLQQDKRIDILENMVNNFAYLLDHIGHIPNGNRTYYLGRSQPPFFACMVNLLAEERGDEIYIKYLPELTKEYQYWMEGKNEIQKIKENTFVEANLKVVRLAKGEYLNRYYDELNTPRSESYSEDYKAIHKSYIDTLIAQKAYRNIRSAAESGWDFSSRWFNNQDEISELNTINLIPVDLNCLLYNLERTMAKAYEKNHDLENETKFMNLAELRKTFMIKYLWNKNLGLFTDYNFITNKACTIKTLATMFPLFFEIASPEMVDRVSTEIENSFLFPGGLVTTLNKTGQQWDAPNGWAPLEWISIQGLRNYKKFALAEKIGRNWLNLNDKVYKKTGKMQEKYNVQDTSLAGGGGEYPNQDGFGWTNGVYEKLRAIYPIH